MQSLRRYNFLLKLALISASFSKIIFQKPDVIVRKLEKLSTSLRLKNSIEIYGKEGKQDITQYRLFISPHEQIRIYSKPLSFTQGPSNCDISARDDQLENKIGNVYLFRFFCYPKGEDYIYSYFVTRTNIVEQFFYRIDVVTAKILSSFNYLYYLNEAFFFVKVSQEETKKSSGKTIKKTLITVEILIFDSEDTTFLFSVQTSSVSTTQKLILENNLAFRPLSKEIPSFFLFDQLNEDTCLKNLKTGCKNHQIYFFHPEKKKIYNLQNIFKKNSFSCLIDILVIEEGRTLNSKKFQLIIAFNSKKDTNIHLWSCAFNYKKFKFEDCIQLRIFMDTTYVSILVSSSNKELTLISTSRTTNKFEHISLKLNTASRKVIKTKFISSKIRVIKIEDKEIYLQPGIFNYNCNSLNSFIKQPDGKIHVLWTSAFQYYGNFFKRSKFEEIITKYSPKSIIYPAFLKVSFSFIFLVELNPEHTLSLYSNGQSSYPMIRINTRLMELGERNYKFIALNSRTLGENAFKQDLGIIKTMVVSSPEQFLLIERSSYDLKWYKNCDYRLPIESQDIRGSIINLKIDSINKDLDFTYEKVNTLKIELKLGNQIFSLKSYHNIELFGKSAIGVFGLFRIDYFLCKETANQFEFIIHCSKTTEHLLEQEEVIKSVETDEYIVLFLARHRSSQKVTGKKRLLFINKETQKSISIKISELYSNVEIFQHSDMFYFCFSIGVKFEFHFVNLSKEKNSPELKLMKFSETDKSFMNCLGGTSLFHSNESNLNAYFFSNCGEGNSIFGNIHHKWPYDSVNAGFAARFIPIRPSKPGVKMLSCMARSMTIIAEIQTGKVFGFQYLIYDNFISFDPSPKLEKVYQMECLRESGVAVIFGQRGSKTVILIVKAFLNFHQSYSKIFELLEFDFPAKDTPKLKIAKRHSILYLTVVYRGKYFFRRVNLDGPQIYLKTQNLPKVPQEILYNLDLHVSNRFSNKVTKLKLTLENERTDIIMALRGAKKFIRRAWSIDELFEKVQGHIFNINTRPKLPIEIFTPRILETKNRALNFEKNEDGFRCESIKKIDDEFFMVRCPSSKMENFFLYKKEKIIIKISFENDKGCPIFDARMQFKFLYLFIVCKDLGVKTFGYDIQGKKLIDYIVKGGNLEFNFQSIEVLIYRNLSPKINCNQEFYFKANILNGGYNFFALGNFKFCRGVNRITSKIEYYSNHEIGYSNLSKKIFKISGEM